MSRGNILIVEDDDLNVEFMQTYLELAGYTVASVPSGEAALDYLRDHHPDLILLDIRMRGMDGYAVCEQVKSNVTTQTIPILIMTGNRDDADIRRAETVQADDIIFKPISPTLLQMRVKNLVLMKQYHDQLSAS
jgi:CheY-like chemotaxis protein